MDIASARSTHKLSQEAIAAKLGVDQGTISRWENGKLPMKPRDVLAVEVAIGQLVAERAARTSTTGEAA